MSVKASQRMILAATVTITLAAGAAVLLDGVRAQSHTVAPRADDGGGTLWVGSSEKMAYLGVRLEEETEHPEGGARVTGVVEGSPAEAAGIREGDIVVGFAGKTIRGPMALTNQIHSAKPGQRVEVRVLRDGSSQTMEVELADRSERWIGLGQALAPLEELELLAPEFDKQLQEKIERSMEHLSLPRVYGLMGCEEGEEDCGHIGLLWGNRPTLGVQLAETTPELREHLGSPDGRGVLVSKVLRGTPAERAGVQVGDLISAVEGEPVGSVSDLRRALRDRSGQGFTITVIRDARAVELRVTLPESDEDGPSGPRAMHLRVPDPDEVRALAEQAREIARQAAAEQEAWREAARERQREAHQELARAMREQRQLSEEARLEMDRARDEHRRSRDEAGVELDRARREQRQAAEELRRELRRLERDARDRARATRGSV